MGPLTYPNLPLDNGEPPALGTLPASYMDTRMWFAESPSFTPGPASFIDFNSLTTLNHSPTPGHVERRTLDATSWYSPPLPPSSIAITGARTPHPATQAQVPPDTSQVIHQTSQHGAATPNPSSSNHTYRQIIIPVDHATADKLLSLWEVNGDKAHRCLWAGCDRHPFKSKYSARAHVQSHLGPARIFECVTCPAQFASEASARRHRDTRAKKSQCSFCHKMYSRKDYRDVHQKKSCPARP